MTKGLYMLYLLNIHILNYLKKEVMLLHSVFETKNLLNHIEEHIAKSHYKVEYIIKELGINPGTYYRKLKNRRFNLDELIKICSLIYPDDYKSVQLSNQLEESIKQVERGEVITVEEFFTDYDKRYLHE